MTFTNFHRTQLIENDICSICHNEFKILPVYFECNHSCCMRCYFDNKNEQTMQKCMLCKREQVLFRNHSPIFKISAPVNYDELYKLFANGKLIKTIDKFILTNKMIIITQDILSTKNKNSMIYKQTIIGFCSNSNETCFTIHNGFIIDRNDDLIYPTYPSVRTYQHNQHNILFYTENQTNP